MLIVCNGAAKSGSTWLYNIVEGLVGKHPPDRTYLTNSKKHPAIRPEMLQTYLSTGEFTTRDVVAKAHYGNPRLRSLLLAHTDVKVLDMTRNLYDVIVSTYYDARRRDGYKGDFSSYYWLEGRSLAAYLIGYHQLWGDGHPQVLVTSFEGLKSDFAGEVRKLAVFLGRPLDDAGIESLRQSTSLDALRQKYQDDEKLPFFRKGVIGDWKNHFDDRMLQDIRSIEQRGIPRFDPRDLFNRFRKRLHTAVPALSPYRKIGSAD